MISRQTQLLITSKTTKLSLKIRLTLQARPRSETCGMLVTEKDWSKREGRRD